MRLKTMYNICRATFITMLFLFWVSVVYAQSNNGVSMLQVLPLVTFIMALGTGALNLYIMNKLGKTREEILTIVRSEFTTEINKLKNEMATGKDIDFMRKEMILMLKNISLQIKSGGANNIKLGLEDE